MLIDWFTVSAQVINFLVLVWLLKRYLYQPIQAALEAREQKIAAELAQAADDKQAAADLRAEFIEKNQQFDCQRDELLKQAVTQAQLEKQRLIEEAKQEVQQLRLQQQAALLAEQQSLLEEIGRRTQQEVLAIAKKTLTDLAQTDLEQCIVDYFIQRLQQLSMEENQALLALKQSSHPISIRSGFELSAAQIQSLSQAINQSLGVETQLQFTTSTSLIAGIELSCGGQKIAWSIADYLTRLEKKLFEVLPIAA